MLIYLIVILLTTLLTFFAQKSLDKSKALFVVLSSLVLFVPSFVAGARDNCIGTDVEVYEHKMFNLAVKSETFIDYVESSSNELLFQVINYVASCLSNSFGMALFLIEFVIVLFGYLAMLRMRHYAPVWVMMLLYLLGFYNLSFNLMRQMVAMSVLLFAFTYLLRDRNYKKYFVLVVLAFLFHKTAAIGGIVFGWIFLALDGGEKRHKIMTFLYVAGCIGAFVLFRFLLELLAGLGGRFEHYVAYGGGSDAGPKWASKTVVYTILLLGDFLIIFAVLLARHLGESQRDLLYVVGMLATIDIMSELLGKYTVFASRLSCYFCAPYVLVLPRLMSINVLSDRTRYVFRGLLILGFMVIWARMLQSTGETVPYKSAFLGID